MEEFDPSGGAQGGAAANAASTTMGNEGELLEPFTELEAKCVKKYTTQRGGSKLNTDARNDVILSRNEHANVGVFHSSLRNKTKKHEGILHRGTEELPGVPLQVGGIYMDKALMSTSMSREIAMGFGKVFLFTITSIGIHGCILPLEYASCGQEHEVLFLPSTRFMINSIRKCDESGRTLVHMTELDPLKPDNAPPLVPLTSVATTSKAPPLPLSSTNKPAASLGSDQLTGTNITGEEPNGAVVASAKAPQPPQTNDTNQPDKAPPLLPLSPTDKPAASLGSDQLAGTNITEEEPSGAACSRGSSCANGTHI